MNIQTPDGNMFVTWEGFPDPRKRQASVQHSIAEVMLLVFVGLSCGHVHLSAIERWGEVNLEWLRKFYDYSGGVPSHDTISRVIAMIKRAHLTLLLGSSVPSLMGKVVALDGKTVRGSGDEKNAAVHMVQAVSVESRTILGHQTVSLKSNEITALPKLLDAIDVENGIVTIDAMGTQTAVLQKILDKKAHAVLALKGNQGSLRDDCVLLLANPPKDAQVYQCEISPEKKNGRITQRAVSGIAIPGGLVGSGWEALKTVLCVRCETISKKGTSVETRYFVTTQTCTSEIDLLMMSQHVRDHWGVEVVHHDLDVFMHEDDCRVRDRKVAENLAILRRCVLNHIRNVDLDGLFKVKNSKSIKQLLELALWSPEFRTYLVEAKI